MGIIITLITPFILLHMTNTRYHDAIVIIPWLVFSFIFIQVMSLFSWFLLDIQKNQVVSSIYILNMIVNLILDYILIKINGMVGAAQSNCISGFLGTCLMIVISMYYRNDLPWTLGFSSRHVQKLS